MASELLPQQFEGHRSEKRARAGQCHCVLQAPNEDCGAEALAELDAQSHEQRHCKVAQGEANVLGRRALRWGLYGDFKVCIYIQYFERA